MESFEFEVEFEHQRPRPVAEADQLPALQRRITRRAQGSRVLFVLGGALVIAWGTTRAGIALPTALCLFFGALPVLWVGGWLAGFLFQARRTALSVVSSRQGTEITVGGLKVTEPERVKLGVTKTGLQVQRGAQVEALAWQHVHLLRPNSTALTLYLGREQPASPLDFHEAMNVPSSAFASRAAFDDFCLAVQRHVWAAQR